MRNKIILKYLWMVLLLSACVSSPPVPQKKPFRPKKSQVLIYQKNPATQNKKVMFLFNGQKIWEGDYKNYLYDRLGNRFLEDFITDKTVVWKAKQLGIQFTKQDIDRWVEEKLGQVLAKAKGRENLEKALLKMGMKVGDLIQNMRKNAPIMVYLQKIIKFYRLQKKALHQAYLQKFGPKTKVQQIFFSFEKTWRKRADQLALEQTQMVLRKIRSKKLTFSQAVKYYSEAANSAQNNGSIGFVHIKQLDFYIQKALKKMTLGDISDVVKSDRGYHIVYFKDQKASYVNLYHIFISNNVESRLDKEKKKALRKELQGRCQKFYKKLKDGKLSFKEAFFEKQQDYLAREVAFRPYGSSFGVALEKEILPLKKGQLSPLLAGKDGYYIMEVLGVEAPLRPFDKGCQEDLKKIVLEEEISENEILELKKKLRQEVKIQQIP